MAIPQISEQNILDAFKYIDEHGVPDKDYLQVLAYMFKFDAKRAFYFYPEATGEEDRVLRLNPGSAYERNVAPRDDISLIKHGLRIPDDNYAYEEFVAGMEASEAEFKDALLIEKGS